MLKTCLDGELVLLRGHPRVAEQHMQRPWDDCRVDGNYTGPSRSEGSALQGQQRLQTTAKKSIATQHTTLMQQINICYVALCMPISLRNLKPENPVAAVPVQQWP